MNKVDYEEAYPVGIKVVIEDHGLGHVSAHLKRLLGGAYAVRFKMNNGEIIDVPYTKLATEKRRILVLLPG